MTQEEFKRQIPRLKDKWGDRPFCNEMIQLIYNLAVEFKISGDEWRKVVNIFIGDRPLKPVPLLSDFRVAFFNLRKPAARAPAKILRDERVAKPLAEILKPHFGGVSSARDALEVAKFKRRMGEDNEPDGAA